MTINTQSQDNLLRQRYGKQHIPDNIHWNPIVEAIIKHHSVRTFLDKPLPAGTIETMVAAAQSASSSSALYQWSLVAITDKKLKLKIAKIVATTIPADRIPWIEEASALLLWVADLSRSAQITKKDNKEPFVLDYLDSFLMGAVDSSLAAQNAALAAESMGLGIVYLGVMRNAAKEISEIINLPEFSFVTFGMAVGIPDSSKTSSIRPRPNQKMVLHYNQYNSIEYQKHLMDFETSNREFRQQQMMKQKSWQDSIIAAMTSIEYMGGRENLSQTLKEKGFKLL